MQTDDATVTALVITDLAAENAELQARVVSLEEDVAVYRQLVNVTFDALHGLTSQNDRLRAERDDARENLRHWYEDRLLALGACE